LKSVAALFREKGSYEKEARFARAPRVPTSSVTQESERHLRLIELASNGSIALVLPPGDKMASEQIAKRDII
jgi:hypothetical protein